MTIIYSTINRGDKRIRLKICWVRQGAQDTSGIFLFCTFVLLSKAAERYLAGISEGAVGCRIAHSSILLMVLSIG